MNRFRLRALLLPALLTAAFTTQAADAVKIGYLTTLSGPGAAVGQEIRDGFSLALKLSGDKLGGLPADVTMADDQQNPEHARQTAERFIKKDKVDILTGVVFSNVLLPILPMVLASDTVMISPNTGPDDYAGAKCHRNFFVASWQNEDIPQASGKFATERKFNRIALIAPNYPGGRESLGGFKREYKGEVVEEIYSKLGQLDYSAELAMLRASKADAVFFFLPGGMGVNFIKQFDAAGLGKQMALLAPGFSADEDTIKAVGASLVGAYNASHWAADLPNPENRKFVEEFRKAYGRTPSMYAAQGYDTAMMVDAAVRKIGGKVEDRDALRKALRAADFKSVRGAFRFNTNQYPVHNLYTRVVEKDAQGRITNRLIGTVFTDHADPFAASCAMK